MDFIGLMTAIIGITGIIGGFFLRKLKKEKDDDKHDNDYKLRWKSEDW